MNGNGNPVQIPIKVHNGTIAATFLKYIVTFLLGALGAAFMFGGKSKQIDDLLTWQGKITEKVEKMDHEGTSASKYKIMAEAKDLAQFEARLKVVEEGNRKIDTMLLKIENMQKTQEELRSRTP